MAALAVLASCGVSEEEAVRYKDEAARQALRESPICTNIGCPYDPRYPDSPPVCVELFFEFGRSPALCVPLDKICEQVECQVEGYECAVFDGFPGQVKCVEAR